ncbi:MAG: glycosyltransferase family 2 protein [Armatimonadetes bacterium]|nr:glycosyltransferase family 2 protein [Armatimonadota bacterium]
MPVSNPRALILMPLYNEEPTLARVLDEVHRCCPGPDILVVNDGSTDGSPEILKRYPDVRVIHHLNNEGYGQSLIDGFRYAIEHGYDVVVTIDCDEQHEPHLISRFLEEIKNCDIVSGSRYMDPDAPGDPAPPDRRQINEEITRILRDVTGHPITDAWCGFKAYRVDALKKLRLTEPSYGMPLQVWVQAAYHGLRVKEIPVARIYKNPNRQFWGGLDDAATRRAYYLKILDAEVERWRRSS